MGLAESSAALRPRPMTSKLSFPPSSSAFFRESSLVATAAASNSVGKWLTQLEQRSRMRPLRGSVVV